MSNTDKDETWFNKIIDTNMSFIFHNSSYNQCSGTKCYINLLFILPYSCSKALYDQLDKKTNIFSWFWYWEILRLKISCLCFNFGKKYTLWKEDNKRNKILLVSLKWISSKSFVSNLRLYKVGWPNFIEEKSSWMNELREKR